MPEESGDTTAEALLAAAQEYDTAVEAGETPSISVVEEEPEKVEKEETPAPEEPTEVEEGKPPETEGDNVDEPDSSLTDGETSEDQENPPKSKYAKNRARLDKSWSSVNEAKEANKRDAANLAEAKALFETERAEAATLNGYRDEHGHTAQDYAEAAKGFEEEGDISLRDSARAKADELHLKEAEATQKVQVDKYADGWKAGRQALEREMPELTDSKNQLTIEANEILKANPDLFHLPEARGLRQAVDMARYKLKADKADSSQAEAKELSDKLTKLEKKTSVTGGFTSDRPDGEAAFDDMSDDEQENFLRRAAMAHDEGL